SNLVFQEIPKGNGTNRAWGRFSQTCLVTPCNMVLRIHLSILPLPAGRKKSFLPCIMKAKPFLLNHSDGYSNLWLAAELMRTIIQRIQSILGLGFTLPNKLWKPIRAELASPRRKKRERNLPFVFPVRAMQRFPQKSSRT